MNLTTNSLFSFAPFQIDGTALPYSFMPSSNQTPILSPMVPFNFNYGMNIGMPIYQGYPVLYQRFSQ